MDVARQAHSMQKMKLFARDVNIKEAWNDEQGIDGKTAFLAKLCLQIKIVLKIGF